MEARQIAPCPFCGNEPGFDDDIVAPRVTCQTKSCGLYCWSVPPEKWNQRTLWVSTSERKPTEKDGDHGSYVLWHDPMFGAICAPFDKWEKDGVEGYRYWMPIPPLPEQAKEK